MYALVDCNNFYCSCEKLFQPSLSDKPVIVLSNNDGCAIARCEQAKALGIDMGTPAFMIRDLIANKNVRVFSSNYTLYGDMSDRVMRRLSSFAPSMEVYSIDEAFLNLSELKESNHELLACDICETIKKEMGIPITIGVASTKVLAKMANRYAKKKALKPGVFFAGTEDDIREMLDFTGVEDIWGIGHQHAQLLKRYGFRTANDLLSAPEEWIRKQLSVVGLRILNELKGIPSIACNPRQRKRKNICISRSFGKPLSRKEEIKEALCNHAASVAFKLRQEASCAASIQIFIQTNPHKTGEDQYLRSVDVQLQKPSNETVEIIKYACEGLDFVFKNGLHYMKCGIIATKIISAEQVQTSLFHQQPPKAKRLNDTMDAVNRSLGKDVVRAAIQGFDRAYKMKAEYLSSCYTTDFKQILKVKN